MKSVYYDIHIKELEDYFEWELTQDAQEYHSLVILQTGRATTIEEAFAAANTERNKYIKDGVIKS